MLNLSLYLPRNTSSSSDCLSLCVLLHFMEENCQPLTLPLLFSGQHPRNSNPTPFSSLKSISVKTSLFYSTREQVPHQSIHKVLNHPWASPSSLFYGDQPKPVMDRGGNLPNSNRDSSTHTSFRNSWHRRTCHTWQGVEDQGLDILYHVLSKQCLHCTPQETSRDQGHLSQHHPFPHGMKSESQNGGRGEKHFFPVLRL